MKGNDVNINEEQDPIKFKNYQIFFIITGLTLISSPIWYGLVINYHIMSSLFYQIPNIIMMYISLVGGILIVIASFYPLFAGKFISHSTYEFDSKQDEEERNKILLEIDSKVPTSDVSQIDEYCKLISVMNIQHLHRYYTIIGKQADLSFNFAVLIAFIGFLVIGYSIFISLNDISTATKYNNISLFSWIGAVIIEFISGICFYLYRQSQHYLKEHKNALLDVQNVLLCLWMANKMVKAPDQQITALRTIIEKLSDRNH